MILWDSAAPAQGSGSVTEDMVAKLAGMDWGGLLADIVTGIIGVAVILLVIRLVDHLIAKGLARTKRVKLVGTFIRKLVKYVCYAITVVWFLEHIGVNMTQVLAGAGVIGVIIGLASQETVSNFFSGLMIIINKPFEIGDYIENGAFSGTVADMDMHRVVLLTPDNKRVTMSNKLVWSNPVVNYNAMDKRRVDMVASVAYGTDVDAARAVLLSTISAYPEVLKDPKPTVEVGKLSSSSVDFIVRPWVKPADYWKVLWRFQGEVCANLNKAGIKVPYNQIDVHVVDMAKAQ